MSDPTRPITGTVSRRTALRALGAGAGGVALLPWLSDEGLIAFTGLQQRNGPPTPRVVPDGRFATLEAFVDAIIPSDERSPGAKEARVADYIDLLLNEADDDVKMRWLGGLEALDAEATVRFGSTFARLDPASTDILMAAISRNEQAPATPLEMFFTITKQATLHGYYTSEIGIHRELQYKGNQMLQAFVGCTTQDGQDCPHCKQKAER